MVGKHDVVDADIAPASGDLIDDLQPSLLAFQLADVEGGAEHAVVVAAGDRCDDLVVDQQIDARPIRMGSAADEELDEMSLDREGATRQRADLAVLFAHIVSGCRGMAVDDTLALAADVALVVGDVLPEDRASSESRALGGPALVRRAFEIVEDDIRAYLLGPCPGEARRQNNPER